MVPTTRRARQGMPSDDGYEEQTQAYVRSLELKFEDFLKHCRLSEYDREELGKLRDARDRSKYYNEAIFWIELNEADSSRTIFHNYLIENRIFMTQELREKFSAVDDVLSAALIEYRIATEVWN
jgi:hypothetical protein